MIFYQILNTFFKEIYRDQLGEFVCGYWGLSSGKLPTFPFPKPSVTLTSHLGQNFGLGEGWVGSFPGTLIDEVKWHYFYLCWLFLYLSRYNENLELEDAIHTAILTLKVRISQL